MQRTSVDARNLPLYFRLVKNLLRQIISGGPCSQGIFLPFIHQPLSNSLEPDSQLTRTQNLSRRGFLWTIICAGKSAMKTSLNTVPVRTPFIFDNIFNWPGLKLAHWRAGRGEMSECTFDGHGLTVTLEGRGLTRRQTATGTLRTSERGPGSLCLVPSGQPVSLIFREEVECLSLFLEPQRLERTAADAFYPGRVELLEICDREDPLIQQIGLALLREAESETPAGRLYTDSLIHTLSLHLIRHYTNAGERMPAFNGGLSGWRLRRAQEFISENLEADLTLEEIAEAVGLSPFHFARAFKRSTGMTPQQYLWQQRIERARELLSDDELPIVEISARAGFKNQSHFTTLFRKFTAMTPKAYRDAVLR